MNSWEFYLGLVALCLVVQGFFAMMEMASVSFNKVRLQYYVSRGNTRALWLSRLLNNPGMLFGTSLICVNGALQLGSECARRFYEALGLSPDLAPLSQVVIVLIFAEIAPLFAGRRYAEHAAMIGVPILYGASVLLRPVIWLFDQLCRVVHWFLGSPQDVGLYLSREELQKILEEGQEEELSTVVANIFTLKNQVAKDLMKPLSSIQLVPSICTVSEMRSLLTSKEVSFVPIYHKEPKNIVAIAYPRDLLRLSESKKIRDHARPPWFITENDGIMAILKQFRTNSQSVAIVLSDKGFATGVLLLDEIIDEIFGQEDSWISMGETLPFPKIVVDRSFPGDMLISEFNALYQVTLALEGAETLSDLITHSLGHPPAIGESIKIDSFEFTASEVSLLGAKTIAVRSIE